MSDYTSGQRQTLHIKHNAFTLGYAFTQVQVGSSSRLEMFMLTCDTLTDL